MPYLLESRSERLLNRIRTSRTGELGVSIVTGAEWRYGAAKSRPRERNRAALHAFLTRLSPVLRHRALVPHLNDATVYADEAFSTRRHFNRRKTDALRILKQVKTNAQGRTDPFPESARSVAPQD